MRAAENIIREPQVIRSACGDNRIPSFFGDELPLMGYASRYLSHPFFSP